MSCVLVSGFFSGAVNGRKVALLEELDDRLQEKGCALHLTNLGRRRPATHVGWEDVALNEHDAHDWFSAHDDQVSTALERDEDPRIAAAPLQERPAKMAASKRRRRLYWPTAAAWPRC